MPRVTAAVPAGRKVAVSGTTGSGGGMTSARGERENIRNYSSAAIRVSYDLSAATTAT
jgi:hypothetical protein